MIIIYSDDTQLASGTKDGGIFLWDVETKVLLKQILGHTGGVEGLCFSPDGKKLVSCGNDCTFQVLDLVTGMALYNKTLPSPLISLCWDGCILFLGSNNGCLYVWDLIEVKLLHQINAHKGPIKSVKLASNKNFVVTGGDDHFIRVWNPT